MSIKLLDVINNYKGLAHQKQAITALEHLLVVMVFLLMQTVFNFIWGTCNV